jgi:hypothetical protein
MRELYLEAWCVINALIITLAYTLYPGPYFMGAFTFIAQPLFILAIISYIVKCIKVLRKGHIL